MASNQDELIGTFTTSFSSYSNNTYCVYFSSSVMLLKYV